MSVETDLVTAVQTALATANVFHLEIFQGFENPEAAYPCVIYELMNDTPEEELDGNSGVWTALYAISIATRDGAILRAWANALAQLSGVYGATGWQQWKDGAENFEPPAELQESGVLFTQLEVTFIREGK